MKNREKKFHFNFVVAGIPKGEKKIELKHPIIIFKHKRFITDIDSLLYINVCCVLS